MVNLPVFLHVLILCLTLCPPRFCDAGEESFVFSSFVLAIEEDSREKRKNEARTGGGIGGQLPLGDSVLGYKIPIEFFLCLPSCRRKPEKHNATHSRHLHGPIPVWARHTHTGDFGPSRTSRPRRN